VDAKAVFKRSARRASRSHALAGGVGILERVARPLPGVLPVLTYHRIDEPERSPELYPGLIGATPEEFDEQMRFLSSRYRPLSLEELLAIRRGEAALPPRAVMVTFDDGYRSVAEHAWPIMRRHGVPLTLFVPTAYPGDPGKAFWWDRLWSALGREDAVVSTPLGDLPVRTPAERLSAYRRLRGHAKSLPHERAMAIVDDLCRGSGAEPRPRSVLGWDELRGLAAEGVAIGSHSRTHPLLDKVTSAEAGAEIRDSLGDLERELGPTPRVFAYPGGGVNSGAASVLEEEGVELAFLASRGLNDLSRPEWLRLRRINVGRSSGLTGIRLQLLPQWARIQRARRGKVHVFLTRSGLGRRTQRARLGALGVSSGPLPRRLTSDGREDNDEQ
jgi:peptidoglycan/xylan/chitin deacetylase (PgdA/CDA1 family)